MWQLRTEQRVNEDGASYTAYGFECGECRISDFSSVREEAERFVEMLNINEASPIHIFDIIDDYFAML